MAGQPPPSLPALDDTYWLHSGLAYPLAYSAKAIASVFNVSSASALDLMSKVIPPIIGVVSMLVVYAAGARIMSRTAGLFASLAWGTVFYAYFIGVAGYVDRDGLSVLLIMLGALAFYLSRSWSISIGNRNVGWLVGGAAVLAIEGMLILEWTFVGAGLLLAVIGTYAVLRFLIGYTGRLEAEPNFGTRVSASLGEINPRVLAVIAGGNILALGLLAIVDIDFVRTTFEALWRLFKFGGSGTALGDSRIGEMVGLTPDHIIAFYWLLIPMALGAFVGCKRRSEGAIFFTSWFVALLALSLFAGRVLIYATPAACFLAGAGLALIWEWHGRGTYHLAKKAVVGLLLLLILWSPMLGAYAVGGGANGVMAPDRDWQDALAYLREGTPQESVVMTHWNYGYWILDLGDRRPVVDNGYYYFDKERNHDIGVAYTTNDPAEAAEMLAKHGAHYLIFSAIDKNFAGAYMAEADLGPAFEGLEEYPPDSLILRTLEGDFESAAFPIPTWSSFN